MSAQRNLTSIACCVLLAVGMSFCGQATDNYLYWMIDQSESDDPIDFQFARMVGEDGEVYKTSDGNSGVFSDSYAQSDTEGSYMSEAVMNIGDSSVYGSLLFYIELARYDNGNLISLGKSESYAFADVRTSISDGSGLKPANTLRVGTFTIPEPSAGLLTLLGVVALGLKRKIKG